ncbi:MAG: 2-C-methyl-D-erythritol 4-phosphate cytidylyltransferase [Oscillospiraceae bacterium]|nr:2-C-methyl-D-erythritol 4-phosphate cytidylyltransferase [Oscillospiraceae bacterium]
MGASIIIAAAGSASRMQGLDKLMYKIGGREVFMYSVLAFDNSKCTDKIVVVTSEDKLNRVQACLDSANLRVPYEVVLGGDTRQKSITNGLNACLDTSNCVIIHDAARPMITPELIDRVYEEAIINDKMAATLGVKVKDTVKQVSSDETIEFTPDRSALRIAQTPQIFEMSLYKLALSEAVKNNKDYTDDCQLVEAIGRRVYVVEGDYKNIKITTPEDLILAEVYLKERENA